MSASRRPRASIDRVPHELGLTVPEPSSFAGCARSYGCYSRLWTPNEWSEGRQGNFNRPHPKNFRRRRFSPAGERDRNSYQSSRRANASRRQVACENGASSAQRLPRSCRREAKNFSAGQPRRIQSPGVTLRPVERGQKVEQRALIDPLTAHHDDPLGKRESCLVDSHEAFSNKIDPSEILAASDFCIADQPLPSVSQVTKCCFGGPS